MLSIQDQQKLEMMLFPYSTRIKQAIFGRRGRLVHYTTAESAIKIIRSNTVWMRNIRTMSDFSEVEYGHQLLMQSFLNDRDGSRFLDALNQVKTGLAQEVLDKFRDWWANVYTNSYIFCMSEHVDGIEDKLGRLSMWRAYGSRNSGVAFVLKCPNPGVADPLSVYLEPVLYDTPIPGSDQESSKNSMLHVEFVFITQNIEEGSEFLGRVDRKELVDILLRALIFSTLCVKHPAFVEEKEWRLIYLPYLARSQHVSDSVEIISGVPQIVHELRLENRPEENIQGISFAELFDRVIVGPTENEISIYDALVRTLADAGIPDPERKVVLSRVPLR
jgi:hypothetical protein